MTDVFEKIISLRKQGIPAALATVVEIRGSVPGSESLKMLIDRDGKRLAGTVGGGCVEAEILVAGREVIDNERPQLLEFTLTEEETGVDGLICGGRLKVFIEPIVSPICYIFGAGHISLSTSQVAKIAGFGTVVIDDREAFANRERFPHVDAVHSGPFLEVAAGLSITPNSYLLIVTRGHAFDREILRWAVSTPARYIGMLGSRRKVLTTFKSLVEEEGVEPRLFERVRAPVGLDVSAVTHEEIAVAIVAEMIEARREAYRKPRQGPRRAYELLRADLAVAHKVNALDE